MTCDGAPGIGGGVSCGGIPGIGGGAGKGGSPGMGGSCGMGGGAGRGGICGSGGSVGSKSTSPVQQRTSSPSAVTVKHVMATPLISPTEMDESSIGGGEFVLEKEN